MSPAEIAINTLKMELMFVDEPLKSVCQVVLSDTLFSFVPASKDKHHAYQGGLAVHTAEVVDRAADIAGLLDNDQMLQDVIVAGIWHDYAKIHEYRPGNILPLLFEETEYKSKIYHIAGSFAEFVHVARLHNVDESTIQRIGHLILSHHGPRACGFAKPVIDPQTEAALILHQADSWSAWYGPGAQRNAA